MRVAFLYNECTEDPAFQADEADPAESSIVVALRRCGHDVTPISCTLDLAALRHELDKLGPDVVFNRVESLGGSDAMMAAVPMLLESLQLSYTGCPAEPQLATANKVITKERLMTAGLPTPAWVTAYDALHGGRGRRPHRFIVKSVLEHASFQMDDDAVVDVASPSELQDILRRRAAETGRPFFAEEYIDGREFNLALLGSGPTVLPPAEIDFSAFPASKLRIVGYRAKWDDTSFEFHNTPRRYDFPTSDRKLVERVSELAQASWRLFRLQGYARIDVRCDQHGGAWILEVNTNPCLSPNAGFAAAFEAAGISYDDGLRQIIDDALERAPRECQPPIVDDLLGVTSSPI